MRSILRMTLQLLCNLTKCRMSIKRIFILILAIMLFYLFVYTTKDHYSNSWHSRLLKNTNQYPELGSRLQKYTEKYPRSDNRFPDYSPEYTNRLLKYTNKYTNSRTRLLTLRSTASPVEPTQNVHPQVPTVITAPYKPPTNQVQARVLLVYDSVSTHTAKGLKVILESLRIPVDVYRQRQNKSLSLLVQVEGGPTSTASERVGKYSLLMFADYTSFYQRWLPSDRQHYTNYCRLFNVTSIFFSRDLKDVERQPLFHLFSYKNISSFPINSTNIHLAHVSSINDLYFSKNHISVPQSHLRTQELWNTFLPITSPELHHYVTMLSSGDHVTCNSSHMPCHMMKQLDQFSDYSDEAIFSSHENFEYFSQLSYFSTPNTLPQKWPFILVDKGLNNSATNVFFGSPVSFWLTKILLMDMLKLYSPKKLFRFDRRRWVMIDIDDIFVAPEGKKMNREDVQALLTAQTSFRKIIPGLTFNLGFCGGYYDKGTAAEILGSKELVKYANSFNWFGHIFNHYQPHLVQENDLITFMKQNLQFALNNSIPALVSSYSVSPHHSGVYPLYTPLYNAWRRVWNVTMTTTEEYPHLYPDHLRRGYIHRGVMVLPRQTCKLFTHTVSYDTFPGGRAVLESAANGGSVFNTLLSNPISIFMTHVTNYATDRLALQLFKELFNFTLTWTNLELATDRPLNLGRRFFEIFPEDKIPLWASPCRDHRHREIYPPDKNCTRLPSFLILGPQKTGTTALYTFLRLHPDLRSNMKTRDHFEEVQFFSNETLYNYGVEWYMDQFQYPRSNNQVLFEKSATYFTHPLAPKRVKALLPGAKLIVILLDPVKRAYSWYQHMRSHLSPVALKYPFTEVITSNENINQTEHSQDERLLSLRKHCLLPGQYYKHIQTWLKHFPSDQLLFVDGGLLVENPAVVMETVQKFLGVEVIDYNKLLRFNSIKGFYCTSVHHCLGPSKGRKYPPIKPQDIQTLEQAYHGNNIKLSQLLKRLGRELPTWLKEQV